MPKVTADRRSAPRYAMVLAADVVELPRGAKLAARTSDISRTGCYIDTLNPIPQGSQVRLRITHHEEVFEAIGRVVYASPGLGMGIVFDTIAPEQQAILQRWLEGPDQEY
jgi:Ribonuclease G/E